VEQDKKGPGVRFPPPLIAGLVITFAYALDLKWPWPIDGPDRWVGITILIIALVLVSSAIIPFFVFRTSIEPWKPTSTIIKTGIYRFSRNPIYLSFLIIVIGLGIVFNSVWILIAMPFVLVLLQILVIAREESYLKEKFGLEYEEYCNSTRRWF
jgi:protein-S-isoprenylcysteine O-methyltransferase Ste14